MRNKVSFEYFESVFKHTAKAFCQNLRCTYKGYHLTAIDGDQLLIERMLDAISLGYRGQKCGKNLETFGMKMYLTLAVDMISGAPLAITTDSNQNELRSGLESTKKVISLYNVGSIDNHSKSKHIFTYDRLYFCRDFIELHEQSYWVYCQMQTKWNFFGN
jgi:hypothetical protein